MQFVPEMTVGDALARHPHARWVLAAWHLRGCVDCDARHAETLREVAEGYRLPLERLMADLNRLPGCPVAQLPDSAPVTGQRGNQAT